MGFWGEKRQVGSLQIATSRNAMVYFSVGAAIVAKFRDFGHEMQSYIENNRGTKPNPEAYDRPIKTQVAFDGC